MSAWKFAFSLSKAEVLEAKPPGTAFLIRSSEPDEFIKVPRPSDDPADPLNWPTWRRITLLLIASLYAFTGNFVSASIAPMLQLLYHGIVPPTRPYSELTYFISVSTLFLGASNILWVPLSNIIGRRPVLLLATLLMTLCTVWCGLATSYDSLFAGRVFQAIGAGASETVAPTLVGEIFFMHERGRAMAIYTVFLAGGPIIGGIAGGYIGSSLGWQYIFWVGVALSGACFLGVLFLVPETLFVREIVAAFATSEILDDEKPGDTQIETSRSAETYQPYTYIRSLGFISPRGDVLQNFIRPWRTALLPGTWLVTLHYGGLVGGIVTVSTIGPQLVAAPPYLWGANVGLINVGGVIGSLLGALYTYLVADSRLKRSAKREHGAAEPESRLPTMFPTLAIATCGFFVFGFCAENPSKNAWVGLQVGFAMISMGLMQVPSVGFNYLIDCYMHLASDCFVVVTILRAIIAFAWTFFISGWIHDRGAAEPFGIFGMVMGIFSLLTIPMWLLGKRTRIATANLVQP
ncbi:major facilitator superfamily transporter [Dactylonectria macrodidyma]|uniref:Major facilitator superfamily transporter n=1 Tax=Dactylonectria macrodidyma TaxID=307937 RepID=A0A9P9II73_9HYPO|nr:major facilitator superfamily transporter [Dactylonectria macrodidyma]